MKRLANALRSSVYKGDAYQKERFVIFKEDQVGGRARVTLDAVDDERVLRQGCTEIQLCGYLSWLVLKTLQFYFSLFFHISFSLRQTYVMEGFQASHVYSCDRHSPSFSVTKCSLAS